MNGNEGRQSQAAKFALQMALKRRWAKAGFAASSTFLVALILSRFLGPQLRDALFAAGAALAITMMVAMMPECFRGRGGSLTMALWLIASMWMLTAVVLGLSIFE